jgi:hypothetical protein
MASNGVVFNLKATTPTSCFGGQTLQGPIAIDRIYDPTIPPAECWDCIEAIVEQLQMGIPLTPEFRLRIASLEGYTEKINWEGNSNGIQQHQLD